MKKTLQSLGMAIIFLSLFAACSKKDSLPDTKPPVVVPPVLEAVPKGTVFATSPSIPYKTKGIINFAFTGATKGVWVNNVFQGFNQNGSYITDSLKATTTFVVMAKSKDSTTTLSVTITVGQNPTITFLTLGNFRNDSIRHKPLTVTQWSIAPSYCNTFTFAWDEYDALPGNREITTSGAGCNDPSGINGEHRWYLVGETGMFWHGVEFTISSMTGNTFALHRFGLVPNSSGASVPGEYMYFYTKN
jgi:hypothetical protein